MSGISEIRHVREEKLKKLEVAGMAAYPAHVPRVFSLFEARAKFEELVAGAKTTSLSGRVMAIRGQGAILFVSLNDGTASFQVVFKKDSLDEKLFQLFTEAVDLGDIISVTGTFFKTNRGEDSLLVSSWLMAAKALLPLPDKWHGLEDQEEKLRKRYLDIIFDEELRKMFIRKTKFWDTTREFLKSRGFLEVETPTLEFTTGGAEARPFETHHNDFDADLFLRISVGELWQKRLMAAGFLKTFEIGRVYRNEGSSAEHLQEFTNMEFYWGFANYEDGMKLVMDLYRTIAREVYGTMSFKTKLGDFDLAAEWPKIDYVEEVKKRTGINVTTASESEMKKVLNSLKVTYEGENKERLIDTLWKHCRKQIVGPAFLVGHPVIVAPLAKRRTDDPTKTEMFQPIIGGSEVGRGYSELNDPIDQRMRFEEQKKLIEEGDKEAMMPDFEFVEMLEHGMPPTCGFGFGERLFAIFEGRPARETQFFPLLRPKKF